MALKYKLILASGSPRRLDLLAQAGIYARQAAADGSRRDAEARRASPLARPAPRAGKGRGRFQHVRSDPAWAGSYILAADTVVAVGRRILGKAEYRRRSVVVAASALGPQPLGLYRRLPDHAAEHDARQGRRDQGPLQAPVRHRIKSYLASGEWRGKAGGYGIQGFAGTFIQKLSGSYTAVVGLPLSKPSSSSTARATSSTTSGKRAENWPPMSNRCARRGHARNANGPRRAKTIPSAPIAAATSICRVG